MNPDDKDVQFLWRLPEHGHWARSLTNAPPAHVPVIDLQGPTSHHTVLGLSTNCLSLVVSYLTIIEARRSKSVKRTWYQMIAPHEWCVALGVPVTAARDAHKLLVPLPLRLRKLELRPLCSLEQRRMTTHGRA